MHLIHWLIILVIVALFYGGRKIPEIFRHLGNGPRGGPPTHPLPVSSAIETSRGSGDPNRARNWQALIWRLRLRRPSWSPRPASTPLVNVGSRIVTGLIGRCLINAALIW